MLLRICTPKFSETFGRPNAGHVFSESDYDNIILCIYLKSGRTIDIFFYFFFTFKICRGCKGINLDIYINCKIRPEINFYVGKKGHVREKEYVW
jgi:hypothetical protein